MDVQPKNITFTSGGTEAANAAVFAALHYFECQGHVARLLVAATEHSCLLNAMRDRSATEHLPVDSNGILDPVEMRRWLDLAGPTVMVVQEANNETGVQQKGFNSDDLRNDGVLWICDMVQTAGRFWSNISGHMAFISAHKFGGPKGVGAIAWLGRDLGDMPIAPHIHGGGQERGRRAGTENVVGIAGMAAAMIAANNQRKAFWEWSFEAQGRLEEGIRTIAPDAVIFGESVAQLPNTTCFAIPGVRAEMALIAFDLDGVSVSSGSACSSGKVERSHVLNAMGVSDELSACAIRVSTDWNSTDSDLERFLTVLAKICKQQRVARAA